MTSLGIGTVLGDRYLITRAIKSGGMGVVYAAQDQRLADTPCAIKQLLDTDMEGDSAALVRRKFTEEMRFLATLNHPGVPRIRDFFILDDKSFLVMDLVEGDTLEQELEAAIAEGHALPVMGVVDDMIDVLDVLDYLHHHDPPVVHRDVKPANLIRERASGKIKLVDFGIARMHMEARTTTHTQLGTLSYAPLEQIQGHAEPRSDVYALAATMHHLISGQLSPPLAIPPLQRVVPGVNPDLAAIVNRGFQAAAIDRFGSAAEMRQELMAWRAAHGGKALPPSPIAPPREPGVTEKTSLRASDGGPTIDASPRGAPWMAAFVTAMLVLIAGVVAMGMWNRPQEPPAGKRDTPSAVAALEQPRPSQTLTPQPPVSTPLPGTPEKKTPVAPAPSTAARETPKPVVRATRATAPETTRVIRNVAPTVTYQPAAPAQPAAAPAIAAPAPTPTPPPSLPGPPGGMEPPPMPGGGPPGEGPRGRGPRDGPPGIPTYQISLPSDWVAVQTVGEQSPPRVRYELKSPQLGDSAAMRLYVMDVPDDRLSSCYANTQHQVMTEGWQLEAPREVGGATVIPMRRNGWVGELQMRRQSSNGRTTRVLATVIMAASSGNEAVSMQRMRQVAESYFR